MKYFALYMKNILYSFYTLPFPNKRRQWRNNFMRETISCAFWYRNILGVTITSQNNFFSDVYSLCIYFSFAKKPAIILKLLSFPISCFGFTFRWFDSDPTSFDVQHLSHQYRLPRPNRKDAQNEINSCLHQIWTMEFV